MAFLNWTADLETKIDLVDTEHKQIVEAANQVHEAHAQGKGAEEVGKRMEKLFVVSASHFKDEIDLMRKANYEYVEIHAGIHERALQDLQTSISSYKNGTGAVTAVLEWVSVWLFMHIGVHDRGYISSVKQAGLG